MKKEIRKFPSIKGGVPKNVPFRISDLLSLERQRLIKSIKGLPCKEETQQKCDYCQESANEEDGGVRITAGDEAVDMCESCAEHYL